MRGGERSAGQQGAAALGWRSADGSRSGLVLRAWATASTGPTIRWWLFEVCGPWLTLDHSTREAGAEPSLEAARDGQLVTELFQLRVACERRGHGVAQR